VYVVGAGVVVVVAGVAVGVAAAVLAGVVAADVVAVVSSAFTTMTLMDDGRTVCALGFA